MNEDYKPTGVLANIIDSIDESMLRRAKARMGLALKIADTLKYKGISQKDFAKMMGKTQSEVSEWLSGNRNFTVDTLSDISDCLNINLLDLSHMMMTRCSNKPACLKASKSNSVSLYPQNEDVICFPLNRNYAKSSNGNLDVI